MFECKIVFLHMLLFLLPPSYMVMPIRELVNKTLSTTTKALSSNTLYQMSSNIKMDINMNIMRERLLFLSNNCFRESSILSKASLVPYF